MTADSEAPQPLVNNESSSAQVTPDIETDVVIVGAGVTGLTVTTLLQEFGIRTFTVAKHSGTAPAPRAHITNQRTMEIFRDMGIEERVRAIAVPLKRLGSGVVCTSLSGLEIGRYSAYGAGDFQASDFAMASPCEMESTPQNFLEPVMLENARQKGANIHFYTELVSIQQSSEGIVVRVRERQTLAEYNVHARYAVGCDGARSAVASQLGFDFVGEMGMMSMQTSWFNVDLSAYTAYRPACIYWLIQPGDDYWVGSGTCICVNPWNEWTLSRQYNPAEGEPDSSDEAVIAYARKAMGVDDPRVKFQVKHVSKWQVNHVVAAEYRRGRVFLAGDAAHRHPPASGLGLNTSVQDAYNLAWKLALVLQGRAGDRLLESYNQERQPVGKLVVDHAISTLYDMARVAPVLGFQRGVSREEGYASLNNIFSDYPGAAERRAAVQEMVQLGHRRSNALGMQLGRRYKDSYAVVDDGTPWPAHKRDPVLYYEPTTHPGSYLPHAWVQYEGRLISTLDILEHNGFGLIVGIGGTVFEAAAAQVCLELGVKLPVYFVGAQCKYDDVLGEWSSRREITDRGALLVRPDHHIAWRCQDRPSNPSEAVRLAFYQTLGRDMPERSP